MDLPPLEPSPLVSVIVSNYNYRNYVGEAVESIFAQSYSNWELIVCDDGSTDGSVELLRGYAGRDSRMRWIESANRGQAAAWNSAFAACRGEVICLLDSDDRFHPAKLACVVEAFRRSGRAGMAVHRLQVIGPEGRPTGELSPRRLDSGWLAEKALRTAGKTCLPPTSGLSLRRAVAERIFPLPEQFRICADGYLREAAQLLTEVVDVGRCLGDYRIHGANCRASRRDLAGRLRDIALREYPALARAVSGFIERTYGADCARRYQLEDSAGYRECILALRILVGNTGLPAAGQPDRELIRRMESVRRRLFWLAMVQLPGWISRPLLRFALGDSSWRRRVRALSGAAGAGRFRLLLAAQALRGGGLR